MKHFNLKHSRFLALLLTASLSLSLPVAAFEEWDSSSVVEEAALGFESSVSEDNLSFTDGDAITFEEEDAEGAPLTIAPAAILGTIDAITLAVPEPFLPTFLAVLSLKAGDPIPTVPDAALANVTVTATGTNADGEAADLSSAVSLSTSFWLKTLPSVGAEAEIVTDTTFQEAIYYLCLGLLYNNVSFADQVKVTIPGLEKELLFSVIDAEESVASIFLPLDMTTPAQETEETLTDITVNIPEMVLPMISSIQVGSPVPTIPSFAYSLITLEGLGIDAAGEAVDLSSKLSVADIYWLKVLPGPDTSLQKVTEETFEEAGYFLCLDVAYTGKVTEDATVKIPGLDADLLLLDEPGKGFTVYLLFNLSSAPVGELKTIESIDLTLPQEYMDLLPLDQTQGIPYGTPVMELPLSIASANGSTDEALLSTLTLGDLHFYVEADSGHLGSTLQNPAEGTFTEPTYLAVATLTGQIPISDALQVTFGSKPDIFYYLPMSEDGTIGYVYTVFHVTGIPSEPTTEAPATVEPSTEVTTEAPTTVAPTTAEPVTVLTTEAPTTEPGTEGTTEAPAPENPSDVPITLGRPNRPAAKNRKNGILLSWEAVENAKEYEIYRIREGEKLKKIATTDELTFLDEDVYHTVQYIYYVRAKSYTDENISFVTGGVSKGRKQV